jgi:hypothetical protein
MKKITMNGAAKRTATAARVDERYIKESITGITVYKRTMRSPQQGSARQRRSNKAIGKERKLNFLEDVFQCGSTGLRAPGIIQASTW